MASALRTWPIYIVLLTCSLTSTIAWDYTAAIPGLKASQLVFDDVPGFTRSVQRDTYSLIAPESQVWQPHPRWPGALTAHLISPAVKANFAMFFAKLGLNSTGTSPATGVERFIFVLGGELTLDVVGENAPVQLTYNDYAYLPPGQEHSLSTSSEASLLVFERRYAGQGSPDFVHGHTEDSPLLPVPGEVFRLRKLVPQTPAYDFNIHIMDFSPGEHLNVKEMHYNQHGLLLLAGKGIYRLNEDWHAVQAGDVIWMAPYVPQWYAALGTQPTRYLIYKDTTLDPLETPWLGQGAAASACGCAARSCNAA
ncbi:GIP1 [Auxenochlorella protothecoides x Auxenochlorella symbiontica]